MNQKFRKSLYFPSYAAKLDWDKKPVAVSADLRDGVRVAKCVKELAELRKQFNKFFDGSGIGTDGKYSIELAIVPQESDFTSRLVIAEDHCRIEGVDADGVRQGVYHFQNLLRKSNEPFLATGTVSFRNFLKWRIGRSTLSPTKRPPNSIDELTNDLNYYPEAYLDQLAHEGVNAIWLTVTWKELASTSFYPVDPLRAKRIAKLQDTVVRCGKYGIKVFIFCIEPYNFEDGDPALKRHPEFRGAPFFHRFAFCPSTPKGRQYIYDSVYSIFRDVPGLGGMINISLGERGTTCLSSLSALDDNPQVACPNCAKIPPAQILGNSMQAMQEGMHDAAPQAQLISWLYLPYPNAHRAPWVYEIAKHTPKGAILQYNYESGGTVKQCGQVCHAGDYWLAYPGPSDTFRKMAACARRAGTRLSAKIQVSSTLEMETVSSIPAPSILYRKYRDMQKLGVGSAMQSWLFGAKSGVMTRAAGLLSSFDFKKSEAEFLLELALPEWGEKSPEVVKAWQYFSTGYRQFPICYMFQYYNPTADGAAWPLQLKMTLKPLTPGWKLDFPVSGDAIGECLQNHTIEEALQLLHKLCANWQKGIQILRKLAVGESDYGRRREIAVAEAAGIQFAGAENILRFYLLRSQLEQNPALLDDMAKLVREEIANRTRLLELLKLDGTLGYQAEAEGYKYDADKIRAAIHSLKELLQKDFPAFRSNPSTLRPTRPCYKLDGQWVHSKTFDWKMTRQPDNSCHFELKETQTSNNPTFHITFFASSGIRPPKRAGFNHGATIFDQIGLTCFSMAAGKIECTIPASAFGPEEQLFSVYRVENAIEDHALCENSPPPRPDYEPRIRLNLGYFNPESMFQLIF